MNKTKQNILLYLFITLMLPFGFAFDLDSLINSYNYAFENGDINVVQAQDNLLDTNLNNISDIIQFNIETNNYISNYSNYTIRVILNDKSYISRYIKLNSTFSKVQIPSYMLNKNQYNYTIEIRNQFNSIIFRKDNYQTQILENYKTGFNLNSIDSKLNQNGKIEFKLNISEISELENKEIILFLNYNQEQIIHTQNINFESENQIVKINISKSEIFNTKYTGAYKINSILIGTKRINLNYTTQNYNYTYFTNKSFILSQDYNIVNSSKNNTLTDISSENRLGIPDSIKFYKSLNINFNLNIIEDNIYKLTFSLFDINNNYINTYSIQKELTNTNNILTHKFNGEEFFRTKINGPYTIKNIYLEQISSNDSKQIIDISKQELTTQQISYLQFEKPTLPELNTKLTTNFNKTTNITDLTVIIQNNGTYPAFNFNLKLFDTKGFSYNDNIMFLNINESTRYSLSFNNTNGSELYTTLLDTTNFVDELNEENNQNVIQGFEQVIEKLICNTKNEKLIISIFDSECMPINNLKIKLVDNKNKMIENSTTITINGTANFSKFENSTGNKFEIKYNQIKYITNNNSFSNGTIIQLKPYHIKIINNQNNSLNNLKIDIFNKHKKVMKYKRTNNSGMIKFEFFEDLKTKIKFIFNKNKYQIPINNTYTNITLNSSYFKPKKGRSKVNKK